MLASRRHRMTCCRQPARELRVDQIKYVDGRESEKVLDSLEVPAGDRYA